MSYKIFFFSAALAASTLSLIGRNDSDDDELSATTITRTSFGVPHISATLSQACQK
ncbi:MAG: hypothetical protein AAGJ37_14510 [Pseudomonadota bacterium]